MKYARGNDMVQKVARVLGRAMLQSERTELTQFAKTYDAAVAADVKSRYQAALKRKQVGGSTLSQRKADKAPKR
ncbi:hypothetical protein [Burkholderia pseudomallei]|uniref:hypothetical protein n=2 Tax=Burkholderia pseudomallei TaxID=28450 RepID=UPI00100B9B9D|nr:hypothetical protein [Burkholderia pseudomallei]TXC93557.1 hypothetical protein FTI75_38020 [Burkholderia pseudomallei]